MKLFLVGTLFLILACNGQKKTTMQNSDPSRNQLQLLVSDDYSGIVVSETLVITNRKELQSFYAKVNRTRKPGLPLPDVDFEKELILITCGGERNDGSLPILSVKEETTSQMVLLTQLQVDKTYNSQAYTSPFSIYKMPLTDKEIIFEAAK